MKELGKSKPDHALSASFSSHLVTVNHFSVTFWEPLKTSLRWFLEVPFFYFFDLIAQYYANIADK
jgi:hypothetical protein